MADSPSRNGSESAPHHGFNPPFSTKSAITGHWHHAGKKTLGVRTHCGCSKSSIRHLHGKNNTTTIASAEIIAPVTATTDAPARRVRFEPLADPDRDRGPLHIRGPAVRRSDRTL
ncbi:hypothetical protein JKL49_11255 [Phenylobacterium sp. 20VBR1]|uniref:Uncharacterized protein n=1 Tax=Phenylobacterium glaciei TaxID=2803784 RepID=A0A941HX56_9CAUL|nr:hypothetical protein [Phenylobacterium glaciei]MBR7619967.1 hypothetical protein [Phenylobacterium glaciei]